LDTKSVFSKASSSTFKTLAIIILRRTISCDQHYLLLLLLLVLLLAKSQYKLKNLDRKFCKGNHFSSPSLDTSIACVCVCVWEREREREREKKRICEFGKQDGRRSREIPQNSLKFQRPKYTKPPPPGTQKGGKKKLQEEEERKAHLLGSWSATNADHGTGKEDLIAERKNGDGGRQIEVLRHRSLLTSNARSEKQKNREKKQGT
jgi:hypothetical protein